MFSRKRPKKGNTDQIKEIHKYQGRLMKASRRHAAANRKFSKLIEENGFTVLLATVADIKGTK